MRDKVLNTSLFYGKLKSTVKTSTILCFKCEKSSNFKDRFNAVYNTTWKNDKYLKAISSIPLLFFNIQLIFDKSGRQKFWQNQRRYD